MRFAVLRGFTLVEVLIAVVVLALSLIGLAAIFPAVVKQQRQMTDTVQGESVARSAADALQGNGFFTNVTRASDLGPRINAVALRGWTVLLSIETWSEPLRGAPGLEAYGQWTIPERDGAMEIDSETGMLRIGQQTSADVTNGYTLIPVGERLMPQNEAPRFVWDMAARRVFGRGSKADPLADRVMVAIFVRRVDGAIRLPAGISLGRALRQDGVADRDRRVPVATDVNGRPTYDGRGAGGLNYAPIIRVEFPLVSGDGGVVVPNELGLPTDATQRSYMTQVGHRLVCVAGVVHEVVDLVRDGDRVVGVRIQPELDPRTVRWARDRDGRVEMITTPQPAAAATVFEMTPVITGD